MNAYQEAKEAGAVLHYGQHERCPLCVTYTIAKDIRPQPWCYESYPDGALYVLFLDATDEEVASHSTEKAR